MTNTLAPCISLYPNLIDENQVSCCSISTVATENNKKFEIERITSSREFFCKIKVDNCLFVGSHLQKCDYMFIRCNNSDVYFVELKGSDIMKAYNQILATIGHIRAKGVSVSKDNIYGYIVSSSVPAAANQKFRQLQIEFKKNWGVELDKATNTYKKRV